ncbi:hypothetical protein, partial [uncultured Dubosiella sp.]
MMNKEAIQNKLVYFGALLGLCALLILVAYFFFLRTVKVDVMSSMRLIYEGENHDASVEAINTMEDINQRIQEFYNTIHYTVEPDTGLSNGDTITVKAQYDEALAQQYHFEPENTVKEIVVEGLPNRFDSVTQIDTAWIGQIEREMERYIEEHKGQEIETEFTQIDPREATLESTTLEYAGFLKSMEAQHGDRFIGLYRLSYAIEQKPVDMYYIVIVPNINDSLQIDTQNIYGERAYLSEEEIAQGKYTDYIARIFGSQYVIEPVALENEKEEADQQVLTRSLLRNPLNGRKIYD